MIMRFDVPLVIVEHHAIPAGPVEILP